MKKKGINMGFSLVEIIVAIAILAILGVILIPSFVSIGHRSRMEADTAKLTAISNSFKSSMSEPEVMSETKDFSTVRVKFSIDSSGNVYVSNGRVAFGDGDYTRPFLDTKIGKNALPSIGDSFKLGFSENYSKSIVFTLIPKTDNTTVQCSYELIEESDTDG